MSRNPCLPVSPAQLRDPLLAFRASLYALLADHDGVISPLEAPIFFRQSGLPDDILSLVWQYSTAGNAYNAIVTPVCDPTLTQACAQCSRAPAEAAPVPRPPHTTNVIEMACFFLHHWNGN